MCTNPVLQSLPRVFLVSHTSENSSRMRTSRLPTIREWRGWGPCTVSSNLNKFEHGWGGGLYVFASRIFSLDLRRRHNFQRSTKLPISITSGWSKGSVDEPPPRLGPKFSQFHAVFGNFGKIICWHPTSLRGVGALSNGESWIRPWSLYLKLELFTGLTTAALESHNERQHYTDTRLTAASTGENHMTEAKTHVTLPVTLSVGGQTHAQIHRYSVKLVKLAKIFSYWPELWGNWTQALGIQVSTR